MRLSTAAGMGLFLAIPTIASAHAGNPDPTLVHACIGNVSKVVRVVGVTGACISAPPLLAETPAHWPAVSSQGPQGLRGLTGLPGAAGPAGAAGGLRVVDRLGAEVGLLDSGLALMAVPAGGFIRAAVGPSGFTDTEILLYFEAFNCAGQGNLSGPKKVKTGTSNPFAPDAIIVNNVAYYPQAEIAPPEIMINSQLHLSVVDPPTCTNLVSPVSTTFSPAHTLPVDAFQPPFSLSR